MDVSAYVMVPTITKSATTGGPTKTSAAHGPYWCSMEYLSRKQMEVEIATRVTSFQQIKFRFRYLKAVWDLISKAGEIKITEPGDQYFNIISISKDTGRFQFIDVIAELKE